MKKRFILTLSASLLLSLLASCESSNSFKVTFQNDEGVLINGEKEAKAGQDYVFSVSPKEGFLFLSDFKVLNDSQELQRSTGFVYTIPAVSKDLNISFEGISKETYAVSFLENATLTFEGEKTVQYGDTYSFKATPKTGYSGLLEVSYTMGQEEEKKITGKNGSFQIPDVKGNLVIGSKDLERLSFDVTTPSSNENYTFIGEKKALYGEDYRFKIETKDGYQVSGLSIKENGQAKAFQELVNDEYLVPNVMGKLEISLSGVEKKSFDVNLDFDADHYVFQGAKKVTYGEDYSFNLTLKEGFYKGSNFSFLIDDQEVTESADGSYTIHNVTKRPHIEAFGELETILNIHFSSDIEGALKNGNDKMPYSQKEYRFSLSIDKKYSNSLPNAEAYAIVDGVETKIERDEEGIFTLQNPHKDVEIIVRGLEINSHKVSFYNGEKKVYEAKVPEGGALSKEQLALAKEAYEASVGEHHKLDSWDKEVTDIEEDMSLYGSSLEGISSDAELRSMSENGRYYLENDIEISSVINLKSFSGKLVGYGHSIHSKAMLISGGDIKGVLFNSFSGTLQDLKLDFILSNYSTGLSGIASKMMGGLIENVTSKCYFQFLMYEKAACFVGELKGGEIRNSSAYYVSESYSSIKDEGAYNSYPVAEIISGGLVSNVSVYVPTGADISSLTFVKTGATSENILNSSIAHIGELKEESALAKGYKKVERTFLGMPLSELTVKDGTKGNSILTSFSLSNPNFDSLSFYISVPSYDYDGNGNPQSTFGLVGSSKLLLTTPDKNNFEVWSYFEVRCISSSSFRAYAIPFTNKKNASYLAFVSIYEAEATSSDTLESLFGRFYTWNANSSVTLLATPLYVIYR